MLKVYNHADEFLADNKHLLVPRQLELNIMWLNAHSGKSVNEGHYSVMAKNNTSVVLAVQTAPYPLGIATFGNDCDELLKEVYNHAKDNTDITTCNGGLDDIVSFAKVNNIEYEVVENLRLYKLTEVTPTKYAKGEMATADKHTFDSFGWACEFCVECDIELFTSKKAYVERLIETGNMYYWVVDGNVVSMAANHRDTETAKAIGYVYTPPHLRGNGYAHSLVSCLCKKLLETADNIILYADAANPISNHIYQKIGFRHIGDMSKLKLIG